MEHCKSTYVGCLNNYVINSTDVYNNTVVYTVKAFTLEFLSIYLSIPVMHKAQTEHCRAWGPATAQNK